MAASNECQKISDLINLQSLKDAQAEKASCQKLTNFLISPNRNVDVDVNVDHHVHLHVGHHFSHHARHHNVVSTLCEVSEALTEWKFESITDLRTD